jgi:iron complex transport system ATP-binding protein
MLSATRLAVTLAGRDVLRGVDLLLAPGELTVVAGPNGAGKSTLLKALTGSLAPSRGQVLLDGRSLAAWPRRALARRRAVLAQAQHVGFPFTAFEVVALGLSAMDDVPQQARRRIVLGSLAAVDLVDFEGRLFQQLSGGEQQRVQIARVLCQLGGPGAAVGAPAKWLFLDEPTASLDVMHQLATLDLARAHARAGGGALAILHDLNLASLYADRLVVLSEGRIAAEGRPADVLTEPLVHSVFGERVRVVDDAESGGRFVLPQMRQGSAGHA